MLLKRIFSFSSFVFILFSLLLSVSAVPDKPMGWYCTRNKDHKQPLAAPELRFVEEYGGYYIDKTHGDQNSEKVVYLTFDAGYENGNVEKILDVLKAENVKGAFFILGNLITKNTELVRRMANEGHTVCNHTNRHKDMTTAQNLEEFRAELDALETNIFLQQRLRQKRHGLAHKAVQPLSGVVFSNSDGFHAFCVNSSVISRMAFSASGTSVRFVSQQTTKGESL